jgi:hypothetical protein
MLFYNLRHLSVPNFETQYGFSLLQRKFCELVAQHIINLPNLYVLKDEVIIKVGQIIL